MFELTFLGHQGWVLSSASTRVLIDPLLGHGFGHGGALGRVYPPRALKLDAFPAIDALVLTHEHDDHFDIPSLARVDRSVPVYLSSRSSSAAREALAALGFSTVEPLRPDAELRVGDLRYRSFVADHAGAEQGDEWDVFPFLAYDLGGHGSLLSSVDVRPRELPGPGERLREHPGVWAYANNCSHAGFQDALARAKPSPDEELLASAIFHRLARVRSEWGTPRAMLVCGSGWSFEGERAWINHNLFPIANETLAAALAGVHPSAHVAAPAPGHTLVMRDGELERVHPSRPFLSALPRARWPAREFLGDAALDDYEPATGVTALAPSEREALLDELVDFARYLYGTTLFRQLHSLPEQLPGGHRAQPCLALRHEGGVWVLRYEPGACRFEPEPCPEPIAQFGSGLECWASDLLALLRGQLGASALCYAGRLRSWNHAPSQLYLSPAQLWRYAHPLRRPDRAARLYRQLIAQLPDDLPRIRRA